MENVSHFADEPHELVGILETALGRREGPAAVWWIASKGEDIADAEIARALQHGMRLVPGGVDARQMRHGGQLLLALNPIDDGQRLLAGAAAGAIGDRAEIRAQFAERGNRLLEEDTLALVGPRRKELERDRRAAILPGLGQDVADMRNQGLVPHVKVALAYLT